MSKLASKWTPDQIRSDAKRGGEICFSNKSSIILEQWLTGKSFSSIYIIMKLDQIAKCLAELGHEKRLETYRLLVRAGKDGLTVGEIQRHLGMPKSTFSHHLDRLNRVNLITLEREGRLIHCRANFSKMDTILDFLTEECCMGFDE